MNDPSPANIIIAIIICVLIALIAFTFGFNSGLNHKEKEAVENNAAEYVVDKTGKVSLRWLDINK